MKFNFQILFFVLFFNFSFAQQYLGIVGSNYAGTNSLFSNPANIVDTRHKLYINLAAGDIFIGNNAVKWDAPFSVLGFLYDRAKPVSQRNKIWKGEYLNQIVNNRDKNLNSLLEIRGPAVLYTINSKQSVALFSRARGGLSLTNVSADLATLIQLGQKSLDPNLKLSSQNLNMALNMNAFAEIGGTYAKDISENPEVAIKVGFSAKRIIGLANFHSIINDSDYQLVSVIDPDGGGGTIDRVLNLQTLNIKYGNADEQKGIADFNFRPGYWLGKPSPGRGLGFDMGVSYEFRPSVQKYSYKIKGKQTWDGTVNKYEYKVGFSIVDIGRVNFNNAAYVSNYESIANNKLVYENSIKQIKGTTRFITDLNTTISNTSPDKKSFYANLPTTVQAYFDYKVKENVYVYTTIVQNLRKGNSLGMRSPSLLSVVPRYESRNFELAMPLSLLNDYQLFTLGLSARLGPVFIGSDNLQGLFSLANPRGFDLYSGINIPIFNKLPKSPTNCYYEEYVPIKKYKKYDPE